jgi:BirA family biotin operon repressor/biotin-[acetyl-CoA-carboxylase] ligase
MKSPLGANMSWLRLEETHSTQDVAQSALKNNVACAIVTARHQLSGRGRFSRKWVSSPGESLALSLIFRDYQGHPAPHLVGMGAALAAAQAIDCHLQWPNDLVLGGKKVGGVLTELTPDHKGHLVPIVGIGINLNQAEFPDEIAYRAISLAQHFGKTYDGITVTERILSAMEKLPEPISWSEFAPVWLPIDDTPGKQYTLPNGQTATALYIGEDGQMLCTVEDEIRAVMAADAIFGL